MFKKIPAAVAGIFLIPGSGLVKYPFVYAVVLLLPIALTVQGLSNKTVWDATTMLSGDGGGKNIF